MFVLVFCHKLEPSEYSNYCTTTTVLCISALQCKCKCTAIHSSAGGPPGEVSESASEFSVQFTSVLNVQAPVSELKSH